LFASWFPRAQDTVRLEGKALWSLNDYN